MCPVILLALLAPASGLLIKRETSALQASAKASGIEAVIDVLTQMLSELNQQMQEDQANWEKYSEWSSDEEQDRKAFVQEQEGIVMTSTSQLNGNKQQVQTLTQQVADLSQEIAATKESLAELVQLRTEEHQSHQAELADLTTTVAAVNKATEVLEGHYAAQPAALAEVKKNVAAALTQLALRRESMGDQLSTVTASLLQDPNWLGTDGAAAYGEYKGVAAESGGVVGTLKSIRATLQEQKQASIEKENAARREYEAAKEAKESDLAKSEAELAEKQNAIEEANARIEHFTAVITQATQDIADAKTYIEKLISDRAKFQEEFTARSQMRNQELAATQAALDALQEVTAGKAMLLQVVSTVRSMRSRSMSAKCSKALAPVDRLLRTSGVSDASSLVQVASALRSKACMSSDGFMETQQSGFFDAAAMKPVTDLLHKLISRLEDELAAETSHHEWCQTEKATSAAAKKEREQNIEQLTAEIEELTTEIEQLTTQIAFLASELVRVQQETDTAINLRKQEHQSFVTAKKEHDEVISALDKALAALSGQYAFLQTSFVQLKLKQSPFAAYGSQGGAAASALEMIQDLLNRYTAARTELIAGEEAAVAAHEDLLRRNEQFRKDTTQTKLAKETEKRQATERLGNAREELKANREELAQVVQYIADLRPSCDDIRSTFEERKKRREEEIAALKETLAVLMDPSMAR